MEEFSKIRNAKFPSQLSVLPNPSKDFIIVHYDKESIGEGEVVVQEINGIIHRSIKVNKYENQIVIDMQNLQPGIYIATLNIDGGLIESCKFTLIK